MGNVTKLKAYGFKKVGEWELKKDEIRPIFFDDILKLERVIYAYVVNSRAKYIGICHTENSRLERRLRYHRWRNNKKLTSVAELRKNLKNKKKVYIFAWKPSNKIKYKWLNVDLISGLEKPLIVRFKTTVEYGGWNKQV